MLNESKNCLNSNCGCSSVTDRQVCCQQCAFESEDIEPHVCECGHVDCEPKGFELDSEYEQAAAF